MQLTQFATFQPVVSATRAAALPHFVTIMGKHAQELLLADDVIRDWLGL